MVDLQYRRRLIESSCTFALVIWAIALISMSVNAQEVGGRTAQLFDQFGEEHYGSASARMDNVGIALAGDLTLTVYIIVYRGPHDVPGKSNRYAQRLKTYLNSQADYRGFTSNRIIAVDGGRREKLTQQIWLVPSGATPPAVSPTIKDEQVISLKPVRFDEYQMQSNKDEDCDCWDGRYENTSGRLDAFASVLKRFPNSRGYIVARSLAVYLLRPVGRKTKNGRRLYRHIRSHKLSDPPGADVRMARGEKQYLTETAGVEAARLIAIGCGWGSHPTPEPKKLSVDEEYGRMYDSRSIELWIVPNISAAGRHSLPSCKGTAQ